MIIKLANAFIVIVCVLGIALVANIVFWSGQEREEREREARHYCSEVLQLPVFSVEFENCVTQEMK